MSDVIDAARAASCDAAGTVLVDRLARAPFSVRTSHAALIVALAQIKAPTLPRHVAREWDMDEFATYANKLVEVFNTHVFNSFSALDRTLPGAIDVVDDFTKAVTDAVADHITGPLTRLAETERGGA